jgi:hypothetical protein
MASHILIWDYGVFERCYDWPDRKSEVEKLENKSKRQTPYKLGWNLSG